MEKQNLYSDLTDPDCLFGCVYIMYNNFAVLINVCNQSNKDATYKIDNLPAYPFKNLIKPQSINVHLSFSDIQAGQVNLPNFPA